MVPIGPTCPNDPKKLIQHKFGLFRNTSFLGCHFVKFLVLGPISWDLLFWVLSIRDHARTCRFFIQSLQSLFLEPAFWRQISHHHSWSLTLPIAWQPASCWICFPISAWSPWDLRRKPESMMASTDAQAKDRDERISELESKQIHENWIVIVESKLVFNRC